MVIVKRMLLGLLAALFLIGIAVYLPLPNMNEDQRSEGQPIGTFSMLYREAEKILLATCMRVTQTDEGQSSARFSVDESLVGGEEAGQVLSVSMNAEPGKQYLLYLKRGEDGTGYVPASDKTVTVEEGVASVDGSTCSLERIREDMERQKKILTIPSQMFFYNDLASLVYACDEVVVGRVLYVSEPIKTVCRSAKKGESTISTLKQVFLRVSIENGLYGGFRSGDKLDIVLEPYYVRPVINATDLTAKTVESPPESLPRVGSAYIFFLLRSEDVKSDYYFTVNPYEGYVLLIGNTVRHPYYNTAMSEINDLRLFAQRLRELMNTEH